MLKGKYILLASVLGLTLGFNATAQTAVGVAPQAEKSQSRVYVFGGKRLGVIADPEFKDKGVRVREVEKASVAEKAGLKAGDIIVELDGQAVETIRDLRRRLDRSDYGKPISLRVLRDGGSRQLSATLEKNENQFFSYGYGPGQAPESIERTLDQVKKALEKSEGERKRALEEARRGLEKTLEERKAALDKARETMKEQRAAIEKARAALRDYYKSNPNNKLEGYGDLQVFGFRGRLGVMVESLSEQLRQYFGVEKGQGVLIASVAENSSAAKAGLKAGDVVVEVNGKPVRNSMEFRREVNSVESGEVRLTIFRDRQRLELRPVLEPRGNNAPADFEFFPQGLPGSSDFNIVMPNGLELHNLPPMPPIPQVDFPPIEINPGDFHFNFDALDVVL